DVADLQVDDRADETVWQAGRQAPREVAEAVVGPELEAGGRHREVQVAVAVEVEGLDPESGETREPGAAHERKRVVAGVADHGSAPVDDLERAVAVDVDRDGVAFALERRQR